MHVLGKVQAWLCVILAILGIVWTGRLLQVRNSWAQSNKTLKATYETNAESLASKERALVEAKAEFDRTVLYWDREFDDVLVGESDNDGLIIGIGSSDGLTQDKVVYAFQPKGDGTMVYVGPFKITTVEADRSALEPTWRPRQADPNFPGGARDAESANWKYGEGWRIREVIPVETRELFTDLEIQFTLADQRLTSRRTNLTYQQKLNTDARDQLRLREGELNGGLPEMQANKNVLPQDKVDGLVKAIADSEERRNQELSDVDRLRRELKAAYERYGRLRKENLQLSQTLPKPAVAVSSRP